MYLLTRTQSRSSSGVAPHLESSERNDMYTVLLQRAVLLQIWNTQSCCSGVGPDLAHLEFSPNFFLILESCSLRSQVSLLRFHQKVFFLSSHQSVHFWHLITQFYVWFLAHQRGSVLGYSSSLQVYISYPSQARFWTDRYDLLQQYLVEYSSITACLQHYTTVVFTPREGSHSNN